ncbi:MAG: hypothetical protein ABEL76_15555 [Bradymonadaceae bacterium]
MEDESYEQDILKLAFETDAHLTTASVAYYLGIPSEEAEPLLEQLRERGVLELDSDRDGHLYYRVVDAAANQSDQITELRRERESGVDGRTDSTADAADADEAGDRKLREMIARAGDARPEDDADADASAPTSPRTAGPDSASDAGRSELPREHGPVRANQSRERVSAAKRGGGRTGAGNDPSLGSVSSSDASAVIADATRRPTQRNAVVDSCGERPVVVQTEASCEPDPLGENGPELASCFDEPARSSSPNTALVERQQTAGDIGRVASRDLESAREQAAGTAVAEPADDAREIHRPEHQPGMSLLLSLILCGTGQIYNGEVSKGIMMMVLCFLLWFVLLGWVVHIWSIVDSVVVAERINQQSEA